MQIELKADGLNAQYGCGYVCSHLLLKQRGISRTPGEILRALDVRRPAQLAHASYIVEHAAFWQTLGLKTLVYTAAPDLHPQLARTFAWKPGITRRDANHEDDYAWEQYTGDVRVQFPSVKTISQHIGQKQPVIVGIDSQKFYTNESRDFGNALLVVGKEKSIFRVFDPLTRSFERVDEIILLRAMQAYAAQSTSYAATVTSVQIPVPNKHGK